MFIFIHNENYQIIMKYLNVINWFYTILCFNA